MVFLLSMKHTVLAPINKNEEAIYVGNREFPTEKIILLAHSQQGEAVKRIEKNFQKFKIPVSIHYISGDPWEATFQRMNELIQKEDAAKLLINIGAGDATTKCAATCAAFVNGIKAFDVMGETIMLLPVLKFSYYHLLTEAKLSLLKILEKQATGVSLQELTTKTKMSAPLLSYHVHGTKKVDGLKQLGLIDIFEKNDRVTIKINTVGKLLVQRYN